MEEVNDQIDRLNLALQEVMDKIGNSTIERVRQTSIVSSNWLDDDLDNSLEIPDGIEAKFEQILLELDRSNMRIEDFHSESFRSLVKLEFSKSEVKEIISTLHGLLSGGECILRLGKEEYSISLYKSEKLVDPRDVTLIEQSIADCGHDIIKIRKEIALDVERQLQTKRNLYVDKAKASFDAQLENIDKLKQHYEDKLKDLVLFSNQLEKREMNIELKELRIQKNQCDGPLSEDLEAKLKILENQGGLGDYEENSRIALKIEQVKNKITNMRVEKVISESKQTTNVLSRVVKAMAHEVSIDEKQRKKVLESHKFPNEIEKAGLITLKKQEENFKVYLEKAKLRLKNKELEILEREKTLEEKWMKVTGNKELIEMATASVEKLRQQTEENEREREILEREKLDIVNLYEKMMRIFAIFEQMKKSKSTKEFQTLQTEIASLNLNPRSLGF